MFFAEDWWYQTAERSLPEVPEISREDSVRKAAVIFLHVEAGDEKNRSGVLRKLVKNIKWLAGKFDTRNVVLHSFNHLGMSKSSPEFALGLLDDTEERLANSGFTVMRTPFGYFNEFRIHVAGDSLAKVYKEF